ncbi:hypothetical protein UFOVP422_43 [uncultured Caudovirales phage]|uniref:Uncharacterized protein n=1 Tax=uncultured Caudovirales phage TaxID=2100421 RepID=A0A6J5M546_9CAUD|nr:hypothetical protein UFOVP422_43 [uncultured Caudovirales phage]
MSCRSKEIARRIFHIVEDGREFIEVSVVHRKDVTTKQFDVTPGTLVEVLTTAKRWQESHLRELQLEYKRQHYREKHRRQFEAKLEASITANKAEAFSKMVARVTHNDAVVKAAAQDVRNVLAFYGPALVDRVLYVPSFQWI